MDWLLSYVDERVGELVDELCDVFGLRSLIFSKCRIRFVGGYYIVDVSLLPFFCFKFIYIQILSLMPISETVQSCIKSFILSIST